MGTVEQLIKAFVRLLGKLYKALFGLGDESQESNYPDHVESPAEPEESISKEEKTMHGQTHEEITELKDRVAANSSVIQSAVELIKGLRQKLAEALAPGHDVVADISDLSDELDMQTDALAEAVAENTGVEEPVEPAPEEPIE